MLEGINDLGVANREHPSAEVRRALVGRLEAAYLRMVAAAHAKGINVIGGTLLPDGGTSTYPTTPADEQMRQSLNTWIRRRGHFDAVADFDVALRDPLRPERLLPAYDCGDHLHPSPAGYRVMAEAVPLDVIEAASSARTH